MFPATKKGTVGEKRARQEVEDDATDVSSEASLVGSKADAPSLAEIAEEKFTSAHINAQNAQVRLAEFVVDMDMFDWHEKYIPLLLRAPASGPVAGFIELSSCFKLHLVANLTLAVEGCRDAKMAILKSVDYRWDLVKAFVDGLDQLAGNVRRTWEYLREGYRRSREDRIASKAKSVNWISKDSEEYANYLVSLEETWPSTQEVDEQVKLVRTLLTDARDDLRAVEIAMVMERRKQGLERPTNGPEDIPYFP
jgi:hypothetical protein